MKRLVTITLILFWTTYVAIVAGGLAVHKFGAGATVGSTNSTPIDTTTLGKITLDTTEVAKHSNQGSCWLIIDKKVYDVTTYFGNHPAGDVIMAQFCGKEASTAFHLSPHQHSAYAESLLSKYLLGSLGETINSGASPVTVPVPAVTNNTGANTTATPKSSATYTLAEVSRHNSSGNCWIIVSNNVYNITGYLGSHPAGASIIAAFCGNEATNAFKYSPHAHSSYASSLLASYNVGTVGSATTGNGAVVAPTAGTGTTITPPRGNSEIDD